MQKDKFDRIISFLLGASSAIILLGAIITFKTFYVFGTSLAIFITVIFIITFLFLILTLDAFAINRQRLEEDKKQTKLLEEINEKSNRT